jgi:hypothetical protein
MDLFLVFYRAWPQSMAIPGGALIITWGVGGDLFLVAEGTALILFGFVGLPLIAALRYGTSGLLGRTIILRIDPHGARGWPLVLHSSWLWYEPKEAEVRRTMVVLKFFRDHGHGHGWVPIPLRALDMEQRRALLGYLEENKVPVKHPERLAG